MNDGEALRKIRKNKNLSEEYVSSKLGISPITLLEWEDKEFLDHEKINKLLKIMETTLLVFNIFKEAELIEKDFTENIYYRENLKKVLAIVEENSRILKKLTENQSKPNEEK